jgi:ribulose-5-phosphate 4-epimerase/fuculose-1-phosphate aldolase
VADRLGWCELIYTHNSARVPGPEHHFLINPYGLRFDEVTASSLVKIDVDGNPVGNEGYKANKAGFIIHSAIHMARPDAQCVWHMHTLAGMAVSAQDEGLLPVHMYSHNFWQRVSYHDFEGPSMRLDERERLVRSLGSSNQAIILRNHGLLTIGRTIPEAFIRFWRLNRSCEIQLAAQSSKLRVPSPEVCEASYQMGEEFLTDQADLGQLEFDSLVRKLDDAYRQ